MGRGFSRWPAPVDQTARAATANEDESNFRAAARSVRGALTSLDMDGGLFEFRRQINLRAGKFGATRRGRRQEVLFKQDVLLL